MTYCQPKSVMLHFAQNTYIPDRLEQAHVRYIKIYFACTW